MSATELDILIEQGADWEQPFDAKDANGNPINLVGASAIMQIRTKGGTTLIAELTSTEGLTLDSLNHKVIAKMAYTVTTDLVPGCFRYDIKVKTAANAVYRIDQGPAVVSEQVTIPVPPVAGTGITTEDDESLTTESGEKISTE